MLCRYARWIGRASFYAKHGDWFVVAAAVAVLLGAMVLGPVSRIGGNGTIPAWFREKETVWQGDQPDCQHANVIALPQSRSR